MVARSPVSPRPANLHDGFGWCALHQEAWHRAVKRGCTKCGGAVAAMPAERKVARPRAGALTEIAMRAELDKAGYVWIESMRAGTDPLKVYVPEYTYLPHERALRADFAFPVARLLVEIDGNAHAVKSVRKDDVVKRQEATRRGWRVLVVLPEQVRDGTAVELVKAALAAKEGNRE